ELLPWKWKVLDSRAIKNKYNLNPNEKIDGMIVSPEGESHAIYIFITQYNGGNLRQVRAEIERNSKLQNILILAKSKEAFEQVINEFNSFIHILQYKNFKVLPFQFGAKYLSVFHSEKIVHEFLKS